jgi:hypothetical protein
MLMMEEITTCDCPLNENLLFVELKLDTLG